MTQSLKCFLHYRIFLFDQMLSLRPQQRLNDVIEKARERLSSVLKRKMAALHGEATLLRQRENMHRDELSKAFRAAEAELMERLEVCVLVFIFWHVSHVLTAIESQGRGAGPLRRSRAVRRPLCQQSSQPVACRLGSVLCVVIFADVSAPHSPCRSR